MPTSIPQPTIQSLFPKLTPEEAKQAQADLEAYLSVVIRVYRRMSLDSATLAGLRAAMAKVSTPQDSPGAVKEPPIDKTASRS